MTDAGKLILRLTVGGLMLFHGISKMQRGVAWMAGPLQAHHLPAALAYGVFLGEVLAPVLLIIGFLIRPAAALIIIDMLFAIYLVMGMKIFNLMPQTGAIGGELQFFYIGAALAIALLGSGRYAISKGQGRWN